MPNTDWIAKKQLNVNLINHLYKQRQNILKEIRILTDLTLYNLTELTLDRAFYTNIIAYCQQNRYVQ